MSTPAIPRAPVGASDEYVKARDTLLKEEQALINQMEKVAEQRRALPPGPAMKNYTFHEVGPITGETVEGDFKSVTLADLVADGRNLVVYHLMFTASDKQPCAMCGSFVDGLNGVAPHVSQHATFVAIAKAPPAQLRAYAAKRGWTKIRLLSSEGSEFNKDMGVENVGWMNGYKGQLPGVSVFGKDDEGKVRCSYFQMANFDIDTIRGMDLLAPVWTLLDLLPDGRGNRELSNDYMVKE